METRTCTDCAGLGVKISAGFTSLEGRVYPERRYPCRTCDKTGSVFAPNEAAILRAVAGRKPGTLRSARPEDRRAYYVWRLARFHGGADVTLPMTAMMDCGKDAFLPELDRIADKVARAVFRTDLAGAHRWGRALGRLDRDMPGLPDSAYSGARVADADKPEDEAAELL